MPAILAQQLKKSFFNTKKQPGLAGAFKSLFSPEKTETVAVKGIDLQIEEGELVGFLGPNGAGKTTTIKMLSGILYPTSGEAMVLGYKPFDRNPEMLRQMALVVGNKNQLWWDLPAQDSFQVMKELYDISEKQFKERSEFLIEGLDLKDKVNTQVRKLSLGERMKCELIVALLHRPRVLFLDEPTIGLDLLSQQKIREFLKQINSEDGSTIMLTSHYMQDVEQLCERVVIIDHGQKMFDGKLDELTGRYTNSRRLKLTLSREVPSSEVEAFAPILEQNQNVFTLNVPRETIPTITSQVLAALPVADIAIEDVSLDEVIRDMFSQPGKAEGEKPAK